MARATSIVEHMLDHGHTILWSKARQHSIGLDYSNNTRTIYTKGLDCLVVIRIFKVTLIFIWSVNISPSFVLGVLTWDSYYCERWLLLPHYQPLTLGKRMVRQDYKPSYSLGQFPLGFDGTSPGWDKFRFWWEASSQELEAYHLFSILPFGIHETESMLPMQGKFCMRREWLGVNFEHRTLWHMQV